MRMSRCGCRGSRRASWRGASNDGLSTSSSRCSTSSTAGIGICERCRNSAWGRDLALVRHGEPPLCRGPHDSANDRLWLKLRPVRCGSGQTLARHAINGSGEVAVCSGAPPPSARVVRAWDSRVCARRSERTLWQTTSHRLHSCPRPDMPTAHNVPIGYGE